MRNTRTDSPASVITSACHDRFDLPG